LFKWTEERKTRRKAVVIEENFVLDEKVENDMFFAQQVRILSKKKAKKQKTLFFSIYI